MKCSFFHDINDFTVGKILMIKYIKMCVLVFIIVLTNNSCEKLYNENLTSINNSSVLLLNIGNFEEKPDYV